MYLRRKLKGFASETVGWALLCRWRRALQTSAPAPLKTGEPLPKPSDRRCLATKVDRPSPRFSAKLDESVTSHPLLCVHPDWNKQQLRKLAT